MAASSLFFTFYKQLAEKNAEVILELKNDLQISGNLKSVDANLNIVLSGSQVLNPDEFPHIVGVDNPAFNQEYVRKRELNPLHPNEGIISGFRTGADSMSQRDKEIKQEFLNILLMINIILFFILAGVPLFVLYRFFFKRQAGQHQNYEGPNNGQLFDQQAEFNFNGQEGHQSEEDYAPTRLSKRQQAKMARKQQKQERKEEYRMMIEHREKQKRERREKEEQEQLQRESERREEEEKLQAEKEKQYNKWKNMFGIEEEGELQETEEQKQKSMSELVEYIKRKKFSELESIGFHFDLSIEETVERIRSLEEQNLIQGILDERGKYLYIEEEELTKVANFMNSEGRVSRSELVKKINQIVKVGED